MKLEKVKTNQGIYIKGPYKNGTAYIATFMNMPEYEKIVDWVVKNYKNRGKIVNMYRDLIELAKQGDYRNGVATSMIKEHEKFLKSLL